MPPSIDVSELMFDEDFVESFSFVRTASAIDATGHALLTTSAPIAGIGSVQPATTNELLRLADAERTKGAITIFSNAPLSSGSPGFTADIVTWGGSTWTVVSVNDWSQWGAGFTRATCIKLAPY